VYEENGGVMMKTRGLSCIPLFTLFAITGASLTACMSGQNQATLDAINGSTGDGSIVETFIEYRGPQERWAAQSSFTMHVVAKSSERPIVVVPPAWANELGTTSETRRPAQVLTGEEARAKMGQLAAAIQEKDTDFSGCLYPIHVRMVRVDGVVTDQQGCRGQSSWAKAASETVDFFMASVGK
jgi:hypothetical protein